MNPTTTSPPPAPSASAQERSAQYDAFHAARARSNLVASLYAQAMGEDYPAEVAASSSCDWPLLGLMSAPRHLHHRPPHRHEGRPRRAGQRLRPPLARLLHPRTAPAPSDLDHLTASGRYDRIDGTGRVLSARGEQPVKVVASRVVL
ncbi:hypothetical protein [Streptomyces sp. NPDC050856]|uniref:hypothetical protein n=1 Tax=Streptomyces sp. NPDC050856 TaxID=3154939 RepID=UPI0033DAF2CE